MHETIRRSRTLTRRAVLALSLAAALPTVAKSNEVDFPTWLAALRREGLGKGLSARTLDEALAGVAPIERVIELDRRQPETTLTFDEYMARVVNQARIDTGRARAREHGDLLGRVTQRFGVPSRFLVALWAIESDFGRITGNFPVIAALATLAYDGRRSAFFRDELFNALRMVDRGLVSAREMRGSWAGAMGQSQFMPSSYLAYATDGDGDGKADIWGSTADVFSSMANYLSRSGWQRNETWGREVRLPAEFDRSLIDHNRVQRKLSEWQALGVRARDGSDLPRGDLAASVIQPGGARGASYLIYPNYRVLLRWNRSLYFATAVGYLADRIGET